MEHTPPIAIVGLGGLFPDAPDPATFLRNILHGHDASRPVPVGRWALELPDAYEPGPAHDKVYSAKACLVDDFSFDAQYLQLAAGALDGLDPLYRIVLHVGRQAFRDAVTKNLDLDRVGVVLASIALPTDGSSAVTREVYGRAFERKLFGPSVGDGQRLKSLSCPANARVTSLPASLLARALGLGGGSFTLDAACASSFYAIKLACDELHEGRADAMLAGGVSRPDSLFTQMGFSQLRALSPSGVCRPFDRDADGLVVGEGAGIFVLKRLDDALRDCDDIRGLIRGIGLSNDAAGSLLAADASGQLRAMRSAYERAGWKPTDVDLIECHGTGTPLGDAAELNSLRALWGATGWTRRVCPIGSVKSNVGHLLTAAGAAGLAKTLLAMREKVLPPSINFQTPTEGSPLFDGPFRVQTEAEDWSRREAGQPRRAAVSGFGFGGINAHLLIEEFDADLHQPAKRSVPRVPVNRERPDVAIVGMDIAIGQSVTLSRFEELVFSGEAWGEDRPADRWLGCEDVVEDDRRGGAYIESVSVPAGKFRLPPNEIAEVLPQQLLMLQSVARAIEDAGIDPRAAAERTGVFIGMSLDLNTTNFHHRWNLLNEARRWNAERGLWLNEQELNEWVAQLREASGPPLTPARVVGSLGNIIASRIAREYGFGGPGYAISSEEGSGLRALEIGMRALQRGELDVAVVGAVDLPGDVRNELSLCGIRAMSVSGEVRPFDAKASGSAVAEGVAAVILQRVSDACAAHRSSYAVVEGIGFASGSSADRLDTESSRRAMGRGLGDAGVDARAITYLETSGCGEPLEDAAEIGALADVFECRAEAHPVCAIGALAGHCGNAGAAAGLASVVKASVSLANRVLPPLRGFVDAAEPQAWGRGRFFAPESAQHWIQDRSEGPRRAGVHCRTLDGGAAFVVLRDAVEASTRADSSSPCRRVSPVERGQSAQTLFALTGRDANELLSELERLRQRIDKADDVGSLARRWDSERRADASPACLRLVLRSEHRDDLRKVIEEAVATVRNSQKSALTGTSVYYSKEPEFAGERVAFVFPGSGSHFIGMGRSLFERWPEVLEQLDGETEHLRSQMRPDLYQPRRFSWPADWRADADALIRRDPVAMIMGQVACSVAMNDLLVHLGVNPSSVIGYSLGETAAMFATRAWRDRDDMFRRMHASPLFRTELAGSYDAVARCWRFANDEPVDWRVVVVNRPAGEVRRVLAGRERVYLLIVNAPDECVVGGQGRVVDEVVRALSCEAFPLDGASSVHCEIVHEVADCYRDLHLLNTTPAADIAYYSSAASKRIPIDCDSAAESILNQALHGFDFTKVVEQAWRDGVRVFVEPGPGASCTRMIGKILAGKPHLARAACMPGEDDITTVLSLLARLFVEGVIDDFGRLFDGDDTNFSPRKTSRDTSAGHCIVVPVGGLNPKPKRPLKRSADDRPKPMTIPAGIAQSADSSVASVAAPDAMLMNAIAESGIATARAHDTFLRVSQQSLADMGEAIALQARLLESHDAHALRLDGRGDTPPREADSGPTIDKARPLFDRAMCMEFAVGSVARVLGPEFAEVDGYPVRVRLPDEPLMLVDRILEIDAEERSLKGGCVVTEHDVLEGAWYLDGHRAPVCVTVEAGQADLFLCSYLGIDLAVKGTRSYRLLDAIVVFHRGLPQPGETIRYEIHIDRFVKQGETYLFFFRFEGTIDGQPMISMRDGCAGFFTEQEIAESGGIVRTAEDRAPTAGKRPADLPEFVPVSVEAYDERAIDALRRGELAACFGSLFENLPIENPVRLPGGRMRLVHRVVQLEPVGGRFGLGCIRAEADIHSDDWFLTCHFPDDMVMPGTLMYECCAHTLRILLMRMGWVCEHESVCYEPVAGVPARLKCRGPVTPETRLVTYDVEIKEIGFNPQPYVLADALMYADGDDEPIVQFKDMPLQMTGVFRETFARVWDHRNQHEPKSEVALIGDAPLADDPAPAVYDNDRIFAFAVGRPSDAFGQPYKIFDSGRRIARLPGPPYKFLDRITRVQPEPWKLTPGGWIEAQYDVPRDAWYFNANRQISMPFGVILEIALQPCGWLAAYLGSALQSAVDLSFRNLGGDAILHEELKPDAGTLTTRVRMTKVSRAGGMIIEAFDMQIWRQGLIVYDGETTFGFFTAEALAQQVGIRDAQERRHVPSGAEIARAIPVHVNHDGPTTPDAATEICESHRVKGLKQPSTVLRMIDEVELFIPDGGPAGKGLIRGIKRVDPDEWFFKAHFYQDPVCPGSLGLESFLQLLKVVAVHRWGDKFAETHRFEPMAVGAKHRWLYRGQVVPGNHRVDVEAFITEIVDGDEPLIRADGFLRVDGVTVYEMIDFTLRLVPANR